MKILRISGKNLASLAGEFCVDFEQEPLASSGLFAISGPTGAGKSTLLDALCLALYGATPRMLRISRNGAYLPDVGEDTVSAQDPRTLLRRGAGEAWAEADFVGSDEVRYRARWSVRRSRAKAAGALQNANMSLHRLPDLLALGGTKTEAAAEIEQRIGLSFEQFTRAVLLAQNEFSAFLKTEENERGALLETLTGSTIYSTLSRRAFERHKLEQQASAVLTANLAGQAPLAVELRAQIEADSAAAGAALAVLDARRAELDQQLRWHHDAGRLADSATQAEQALAARLDEARASAPRRRHLATIDALQAARPLLADEARLANEQATFQAGHANAEAALQQALVAQQQLAARLAHAVAAQQDAEARRRAAAPQLDAAKALDAGIEAIAPSHAHTRSAWQAARAALAGAGAALQGKAEELAATRAAQHAGAQWLAAHQQREILCAEWPRWDTLFAQAARAASLDAALAAAHAAASAALRQARADDAQASDSLAGAARALQEREGARQQAGAALAAFDDADLRAQRQAVEAQRESLAGAERIWSELGQVRERLALADSQLAQLAASGAAAEAALASALAGSGAASGAAEQAERSLKAAELACATSVTDLRATLAEGEPCPVCGSADHPYQHGHAGALLLQMLAPLRQEVQRCKAALQDNFAAQATARATAAACSAQRASVADDAASLAEAAGRITALWNAHPLAPTAPGPDMRAAWIAGALATLKGASARLDAQESAARAASTARDAAQRAFDDTAALHVRQQAQAVSAREALARALAEHSALTDKRADAADTLAGLLDELDAAFRQDDGDLFTADEGDWRAHWRADPAAFRAARSAEANQWRERSAQQLARQGRIDTLEAEHLALAQRHEQLQLQESSAAADHARIDARLTAQRSARLALWEGRPVREVEAALAAAVEQAHSAAVQQQAAAQQASQEEARAREALAHTGARRQAVADSLAAAGAQLAQWVDGFSAAHPALEPVDDVAQLRALLALDAQWLAQERGALAALDAQAASAATVLAERRAQAEAHAQQRRAGFAEDREALTHALDLLQAERKHAHDTATALRLQLAQDDARRRDAAAMLARIEAQQLVERRWGRMNELIGSADGKKFRNYAQQFTLDVLLGYANSHLGQLARRYRLERVVNATGPSLGLMVRDQDMGGEIRSVNSLSGGESFLVSLALALGLASLSSNRVRVESLFIDEGFGSLDSETLRVAMDALDALQSMGRKVGVISHVQEMTERIATRILVQPNGGGSSSVTVA